MNASPGYVALRESAAWIDLSSRGKIRLEGEDRARLLHAMSTNSVKDLPESHSVRAFFLTAQGRILTDAYIYNLGDSILLDTEPETGSKLLAHLDKYVIADDVTLADETAQWACIGIEGPQARESTAFLNLPEFALQFGVCAWQNGFVSNVAAAGVSGLRIFVPCDEKSELVQQLANSDIRQALVEDTHAVRIENGKVRYGEDITERYLVQETQVLEAVHFSKGCYLGQEIVERVRSRGQVHRLLAGLRIHSSVAPDPGTKLTTADNRDAAELTSTAYSPALGEVVGLGYVRAEFLQSRPELFIKDTTPPITAHLS